MTFTHSVNFLKHIALCFITAGAIAVMAHAQDKQTDGPPNFDDPGVQRSIQYMLERAQLTRTLADKHLAYLKDNRTLPEVKLMEDASQVMAFNRICKDEKIDAKTVRHIAADTSFKIAMLSGNSTISERLAQITATQPVNHRMELVGDIATTVLMFEVGRRQGLFEALVTDFGNTRFCAGMQDDMRVRYYDLASNLGTSE